MKLIKKKFKRKIMRMRRKYKKVKKEFQSKESLLIQLVNKITKTIENSKKEKD